MTDDLMNIIRAIDEDVPTHVCPTCHVCRGGGGHYGDAPGSGICAGYWTMGGEWKSHALIKLITHPYYGTHR